MKPQQQGFHLNLSSNSRESESMPDWGWWEQMITQASQSKKHRERYISDDERTLLERQSSVVKAQYDMAKHELLSNSSISVIQNFDLKLRNSGKHQNRKPKIIQGNLTLIKGPNKGESKILNECCSYYNLTTAYVNELSKGQRHRLGVAHNVVERTGRVESTSRWREIPRNTVVKCRNERTDQLKAKPVCSDTMTSNLTDDIQTMMIKLRPEKARLIKDSIIIDKMAFKSKKIVKKQQQNTDQTKLLRQRNLELEARGPASLLQNTVLSKKELNHSNYDAWYTCKQDFQQGHKLISLDEIAQQSESPQKTGTVSEQSTNFLEHRVVFRPRDTTRKYRETVPTPNRKKVKARFSERKERTEPLKCIELNKTKSVDSTENSTLKEEYINHHKHNILRPAAEIKSSLALAVECKDSLLWTESPRPTREYAMKISGEQICKKNNVLKRCSCELKLNCDQSESESMVINVLNPTKEIAASGLRSSLFESNDFTAKWNEREETSIKTDLNNFTSISVMRANSKEAQTCLNIKENEYIPASSNLLVKPAIANIHEICEKSVIRLNLDVTSSESHERQNGIHLLEQSRKAYEKVKQKTLNNDSQSKIKNCGREHTTSPSMINISSLSILHCQQVRKLPILEAAINTNIKTSSNLFNFKNMSAVSFVLSSVTITDSIRPRVCLRNRVVIPTNSNSSQYLQIPKSQPFTDIVLKSSSKISLFQSDSIPNFLGIQRPDKLLLSNSTFSLNRTDDVFVYLDSQSILNMSRSQLLGNIEITQNKTQTLRKAPGKNYLDKKVPNLQFSRSFCTMNVRIPVQDITSPNHVIFTNEYNEEEPILSVLYQKDVTTDVKNELKTDILIKNKYRFTQRLEPKERASESSKSQKHTGANLKKVKFKMNNRYRVSECTLLEKSITPKGVTTLYKQNLPPLQESSLRRNRFKSFTKQLPPNYFPNPKETRIETKLDLNTGLFKDILSWPTSYPITSESKHQYYTQHKDSNVDSKNAIRVSHKSKMLHQDDEVISNEDKIPVKTEHGKSQTSLYKNKLNIDRSLPKLNKETRTNKSLKSVFNKCVKTIKSMSSKNTSRAVNTNMSAANCYSKCKQWEQNCYFCTVSRDTPEINKLSRNSDIISNSQGEEFKDDHIFLKRCSGSMLFYNNSKVKVTHNVKKPYEQKLDNEIKPQCTGKTKIIYLNPASYIYRRCDSYAKHSSKKQIPLESETNNKFSTASPITSHDRPLYKSKTIELNRIPKSLRHKVPQDIEIILPLERTNFHKSKSEIILLENNDIEGPNRDRSNIPSSQEIKFYSVSNKRRPLKKGNEHNVNKVKHIFSKGNEYSLKPSFSSPTNFKRFIIRCSTLFRRKIMTQATGTGDEQVTKDKPKVNENCRAKTSFKSLKLRLKNKKVQKDGLKKSKSERHQKESDCTSHPEKFKSLNTATNFRRDELDTRHLEEYPTSRISSSVDANSLASNIINSIEVKNSSHPSNYYRQEKLCCGYAQLYSNKAVDKNKNRFLRDSLGKNVVLQNCCLNKKTQPKNSFKKTNCQIMKKDAGTNCICKKKKKKKTKWVQAELWDEETVNVMSGKRENVTLQFKTSDQMTPARNKRKKETKKNKCGCTFEIKKKKSDDSSLTKECVVKIPHGKKEMKIKRTITSKCKKICKINKAHKEQSFEEIYPCYKYVDCKLKGKEKKCQVKRLNLDKASKVKCTQTPPKVGKPKYTKTAVKTAAKATQVDSQKLSKVVCKVNHNIKFAIKSKELTTFPLNSDCMKNEAMNCVKFKQKNKYVKTVDADTFACCKCTSTDNLNGARIPGKQKHVKKTARIKKSVPCMDTVIVASTNEKDTRKHFKNEVKTGVRRATKLKRQKNTESAIEALILPGPTRPIGKFDFYPWCGSKHSTNKNKLMIDSPNNKTVQKKSKRGISSHKHFQNDNVLSVSTANMPRILIVQTCAKQKQNKNNAITKKGLLLHKAAMTQDILVSSCCTNTTPSIDKEIGIQVYAGHKRGRNKLNKAPRPSKGVDTSINVSSRSTNITTSCDKKGAAKVKVKKKRDVKRALSCPRCPRTPKEKTDSRRKQLHSDSVKRTQTKNKCLAKQAYTCKGRTKTYRTEDKQTSASSKCMPPLSPEAQAKYPTMMTANRTKQICCAFFTAGAWRNSRAAISQNNQTSTTNIYKTLQPSLQIMAARGITGNTEKQMICKKYEYVNAITKDKPLKQKLKIPLSKSSPCCICGNEICEDCKVNILNKSIETGQKGKKSMKLKNKGEGDCKKNNDFTGSTKPTTLKNTGTKLASQDNKTKSQQTNKELNKEAKKMKKSSKQTCTRSVKEAKELETLNKQKNKAAAKEAKKIGNANKWKNISTPKENKRCIIFKVNYQSGKNDQPQKIGVRTKRKEKNIVKQTTRSKKSMNDSEVKTIRIPFDFLTRCSCSCRTKKRNPTGTECEQLYETTFRRRIILFIYVRSCCYFIRGLFRRLLGCLLFSLGVIVWTPCICCFECFRECLFCCCTPYR